MAEKPDTILDDERTITALLFDDVDGSQIMVGGSEVTAIIAYGETGSMAFVPYFAIYKGEHISLRIPAQKVCVVYQEPEATNG